MLKDKHILVIDDSRAILLLLQSMLDKQGYHQVTCVDCAARAIKVIDRNPGKYALLLTDLNMPDMDGMQLLRKLGEIEFKGAVGIISEMEPRIITLAAEIAQHHRLRLIGCVPKPIQPNDLNGLLLKAEELMGDVRKDKQELSKAELLEALDKGWVTPYYQPKVNMVTNKVDSVEVLMRIKRPGEVNAITPWRFIEAAEKHGLLDAMTFQLIHKSCQSGHYLKQIFGEQVKLGINLSPPQLEQEGLVERLESAFKEEGVMIDKVVLEITEERALRNARQLETLNRLRMRGFGVSLDDFGTGFTNVNQLRTLPFSEVKIDRSLIINIHRDAFCQAVVHSLTDIAKQLGVTLVAEGIEQVEELKYLIDNCDQMVVQGYLICLPRPVEALAAWYASWQKQFVSMQ
ncbi:EAL domain-containing response regulator [Shewanella submarina]|uniref:EAL domain-containing protein n=1 Tax=Shewanella submarina TaxID=2016376 RepID=A0ABV7GFM9_9GAMM|nr:EAL domain-containing response regulator [Shewanella submarina]MCL1036000.1 EAL domain-containing response regulator [Shewanella submarina]